MIVSCLKARFGACTVGFFPDENGAQQARHQLVEAGLDARSIAISAPVTEDGVAAEAPGEAYGNESSYAASRSYEDEVQSSAVVLSVAGTAPDARRIEQILQANGARRTMTRRWLLRRSRHRRGDQGP